ncbi:HD domain-containing protein [Nakamurella sp. GG22]
MHHSIAVGRKVSSIAHLAPARLRPDLIVAGTLHDIGYGHPTSGFHPIDGARYLAGLGFSSLVCHLVAHHSASSDEAEERGISAAVFEQFAVDDPRLGGMESVGRAHAALWWADLTTGPQGQDMVVEDRLDEICGRYGPDDTVTRFINRVRQKLINAGQSPIGSIQVPG